jgi:endonuclease-8
VPEGDTVHKLVRAMRPLLEGETLEAVRLRDTGPVRELAGARVEEVAALGKHFLFALGPRAVLRVHLGLHGKWQRYRPGEPAGRRAAPWVRIDTKAGSLLCFGAKEAELIRRGELAAHPVLARLGPDLLADAVDFGEVLARARRRGAATAGDLLLDQGVSCGIGNVYKNEILFLEGLHPAAAPAALPDERLVALYRRGRELLLRNLGGWPRTTTRVVEPGAPWPAGLPRRFVFERRGRACLRCRTCIEFFRQGDFASPTYFCPRCQPGS